MLETLYSNVLITRQVDNPGYSKICVTATQLSDNAYIVTHSDRYVCFGTTAAEVDIAFAEMTDDKRLLLNPSSQPKIARVFTRDEAIQLLTNFNGAAAELRASYKLFEEGRPSIRPPIRLFASHISARPEAAPQLAAA